MNRDGDRIEMSRRDRDRLKVMATVIEQKRSQVEAARLLRLTTRQVRRILRRLETRGDAGIVHRLRGRLSNHRIAEDRRTAILKAYRSEYIGFGPTLAAEKLAERDLAVGRETLRRWLVQTELWKPKRRRGPHRSRRERRECFGELVQADGSHHDWLEGRGEKMVLVAMIDDATSKVLARFYPAETTDAYMDLLGRYLRKHGRMVAMYVDRDSIFRAEDNDAQERQSVPTQFSRALEELGIELVLAHSPQAKGRVERLFQTAQDRLVKELRLAGARNMEQANEVLEKKFLPVFNRRFTVKPASSNDAHRPLYPSMNLTAILSLQDKRKVTNDYTIRFASQAYQILPPARPGLRGGWVIIEQRLDGSLHLRFGKVYLKYRRIGKADPALGALPPDPRSLTPLRTPAVPAQREGCAERTTQPSAVCPAARRSGRTPALPYPPDDAKEPTPNQPKRPSSSHPWRQSYKCRRRKPDISTGAK